MDVDLIFKIAAIGIIVSVLNQVLIRSGEGGAGHDDHPGGVDCGAHDDDRADQHPVRYSKDGIWPVRRRKRDVAWGGDRL